MVDFATRVGIVFITVGGLLTVVLLLGLLSYLVCCAWVAFSNKFRDICKAESLIFEYRRQKSEFMAWKKEHKSCEQEVLFDGVGADQ